MVKRFLVCGDSFSEGMTDEIVNGNYRGWADRVADVMAIGNPGFTYANFSIRGKLVHQVIKDQIPLALKFVTGSETLISFHAGANDVLRPKYKSDLVLPLYAQAVREIAASGAAVMLFTVLERTDSQGKSADVWAARFGEFNANVRRVGGEVGAIVVDANEEGFLADRRFLARDRLHLNTMGHDRVAHGVLEKLNLAHSPDWRIPLPPAPPKMWLSKSKEDLRWFLTFLLPWIIRRIRGKSSGDGRFAKQSRPTTWPREDAGDLEHH